MANTTLVQGWFEIDAVDTQNALQIYRPRRRRVFISIVGRSHPSQPARARGAQLLSPFETADDFVPVNRHVRDPLAETTANPWKAEEDALAIQVPNSQKTRESLVVLARYIDGYMLRPYWRPLLVGTAGAMSLKLYELTVAGTLKMTLDAVSTSSVKLVVFKAAFAKLLIAFPLVLGVTLAAERLNARTNARVMTDLEYDMFEHLQALSHRFHHNAQLGDVVTRFTTDRHLIAIGLSRSLLPIISTLAASSLRLVVLFWLSWQMAIVSLIALPFLSYVIRTFSPVASNSISRVRRKDSAIASAVQEAMRALPTIKSYGKVEFIQDSFLHELQEMDDRTTDWIFYMASLEQISGASLILSQLFTLAVGVTFASAGVVSVGSLVSFTLIMNLLYKDLETLSRVRLNHLLNAAVSLTRVDNLLKNQIDIQDKPDAIALPLMRSAIRFENVSFSYTGEEYQLRDISFEIPINRFVAFVGPSGAGKSTILSLILRFYDVNNGRVLFDGHDLRDVTQTSLREQMGVVLQDTFLFNTSVLNNIRVVRPDATYEEVVAAAKSAELHDFIMSLPDAYDTNVGEAGGKLSGGQRQRVGIARAVLSNAPVMLLDEATSALDAETAAAIDATVEQLAGQRTVIVISHRLASVINADNIFVMSNGRIEEEGSHHNLLDQDGLYAQLWNMQSN